MKAAEKAGESFPFVVFVLEVVVWGSFTPECGLSSHSLSPGRFLNWLKWQQLTADILNAGK